MAQKEGKEGLAYIGLSERESVGEGPRLSTGGEGEEREKARPLMTHERDGGNRIPAP
jgi:hypothetical protein